MIWLERVPRAGMGRRVTDPSEQETFAETMEVPTWVKLGVESR